VFTALVVSDDLTNIFKVADNVFGQGGRNVFCGTASVAQCSTSEISVVNQHRDNSTRLRVANATGRKQRQQGRASVVLQD
jgi:hypothetical protein